jgi:hypothetical protein
MKSHEINLSSTPDYRSQVALQPYPTPYKSKRCAKAAPYEMGAATESLVAASAAPTKINSD